MRCCYTPTYQKNQNPGHQQHQILVVGRDVEQQGHSLLTHLLCGNVKQHSHFGRQVGGLWFFVVVVLCCFVFLRSQNRAFGCFSTWHLGHSLPVTGGDLSSFYHHRDAHNTGKSLQHMAVRGKFWKMM